MLCHFPALIHPNPRSVLIVGCGAGVTSGSFLVHPGIERVVICELEPLVPQVVAEYFGKENYNVVKSPKVEIVYDDAHHFVLTTREKFDIITSDPIHPWMKGWIRVFDHPYFAVTDENGAFEIKDAPAGNLRLMVWHGSAGWKDGAKGRNGDPVQIQAGSAVDLGNIAFPPPKD